VGQRSTQAVALQPSSAVSAAATSTGTDKKAGRVANMRGIMIHESPTTRAFAPSS
jgi:hypothetical protein